MKTHLMKLVLLCIGTTAAAAPLGELTGRFASTAPEALGNGSFGTRAFVFSKGRWQLTFTLYGDAKGEVPLAAMTFEGPWAPGKPSAKVKGATEAIFEFTKKQLTLLAKDPAVAKSLGMDACGLVVGEAKDISATGCSFVPSVAQYGKEFDLVKLEGNNTLFLGTRPADGNMGSADKRPTALGAALQRAP